MVLGNWNNKYSVNNVIINDQHNRLLHILYRKERLVKKSSTAEDMVELLNEMADYGQEYFKSEERYMQRIGYPKLDSHKELHSNYSLEVLKFTVNQLDDEPDNPSEVLNFLTHWWTNHILKVDMDYSRFIENGA